MAPTSGLSHSTEKMTTQLNTLATRWGVLKGTVMNTTGTEIVGNLIREGNRLIADSAPSDTMKLDQLSAEAQEKLSVIFELASNYKTLHHEIRAQLASSQEELHPTAYSIFERQFKLTNKDVKIYLDHALNPLSRRLELPEGLYPVGFSKPAERVAQLDEEEEEVSLLALPSSPPVFVNDKALISDPLIPNSSEVESDHREVASPEESEESGEASGSDESDVSAAVDAGASMDPTDDDEPQIGASSSPPRTVNAFEYYFSRSLPDLLVDAFKGQREGVKQAIEDLKDFDDSKLSSFVTEAAADEFYALLAEECGIEGTLDDQMDWGEANYAVEPEKSLNILEQINATLLEIAVKEDPNSGKSDD